MYKVIIAEDEMFVRLGIKMSVDWEALGMEVVADCANGRLALEAFEQYHPEIVITDIKMPIMDGMEPVSYTHLPGRQKDNLSRWQWSRPGRPRRSHPEEGSFQSREGYLSCHSS